MIQVNLIPDVKLELVKSQRHRTFVMFGSLIVIAASVGVLVVLSTYVFGVQKVLISNATNTIKQEDEKFRDIEDIEKTVTVSNQLRHIQASHENKAMTSRIFALLAEASAEGTENSVTIESFDIDTTQNSIIISAKTQHRGFDAAEVFRKNMEGMKMFYVEPKKDAMATELSDSPLTKSNNEQSIKIASDVVLSDMVLARDDQAEASAESVSFKVRFTYDPLLFSEKIDMLRIRGLDRGNVTDSYTRLPQSLFAASTTKEER